jgi:two-component system sensor histidine kinase KdpD
MLNDVDSSTPPGRPFVMRPAAQRYALAVIGPGIATAVALGIGSARTTAAALIYLLAVLPVVTLGGRGPGVVASALSFVGLNYYFTPPRHTLSVSKSDDLIALVVFLSVAIVVATLTSIGNAERDRARRREYETRSLYEISTRLLTAEGVEPVLAELVDHVKVLFELDSCEIRDPEGAVIASSTATDSQRDEQSRSIEISLQGSSRGFGSLVLRQGSARFGEPERRVASIFAQQLAVALERATFEREAREARVAAEAARVRQALLSAVSHDFRTPLASIKAALTSIVPARSQGEPLPAPEDIVELVRTSIEETERLERLVSNLLDLTRLRSGSFAPRRIAVPVRDIVEEALNASKGLLEGRKIDVRIRDDVSDVDVDPVQVGQVLRNVVENAAAYSPRGSPIRIVVAPWREQVEIRVSDNGPGIPHSERDAVFEEFFRGGDGASGGTGLGLAIARAILRAHGGEIWAEETPGGGATLAMRLPTPGPGAS